MPPNFTNSSEIVLPGYQTEGIYILPSDSVKANMDFPSEMDSDIRLELSAIPSPFRNTVRYIHEGISPRFSNGYVILSAHGIDIHHIVKKSYVKSDVKVARELLPFNGAVRATYDMLTDTSSSMVHRYGAKGNMLINLIPLDYSFHHNFIEERPYDHIVGVRLNGEHHYVTLPELLMSFNVFNLRFRLNALTNHILRSRQKAEIDVSTTPDSRLGMTQKQNLIAWELMERELPRIEVIAEEIEDEHPHLFEIWMAALGIRGKYVPQIPVVEQ